MMLKRVKLVDSERDGFGDKFYYRSRVVDIVTDRGGFSTPSRMVSGTEHAARSESAVLPALPQDIAADFRTLRGDEVDTLLSGGGTVPRLARRVEQYNDVTRKAKLRISIFQPAHTVLCKMSTPQKIRYADLQAKSLQLDLGTRLVTFPFLDLPHSEYARFIDDRHGRDDFSAVFVLDLKMDRNTLEKILDHLTKKEEPMIIAFIYRDWEKTAPQHELVASHFDNEKTAFLACQVPREIQAQGRAVSNLHSVAIGSGFDMVALGQSRAFGGSSKLRLDRIGFFSPQTLDIDGVESALLQRGRSIHGEFDMPDQNSKDSLYLKQTLRGYREAARNREKHAQLARLARLHEALASPKQFDASRRLIRSREVGEYIRNTSLSAVPMILKASRGKTH